MEPTANLAGNNPSYPFLDIDPPPPYSGPVLPQPQFQSYFQIPTYESASNSNMDDSIRLPSYSGRSLHRFHPYWPYTPPRPSPESFYDGSRYLNTILDEEYVPLDVPSAIARAPVQPQAAAVNLVPLVGAVAAPPAPVQEGREPEPDIEEQRRQRVYRLRAVIVDFLLAVKRAIEARPPVPPIVVQGFAPETNIIGQAALAGDPSDA